MKYYTNLLYGDNLEWMKIILKDFKSKIKLVYSDCPYNTKQQFTHYNDNKPTQEWLDWLKPRLLLIKDLLSEDGSLWVSIDSNESHYLKILLDIIFGRVNFIDEIIWERMTSTKNHMKFISRAHESIFLYAKNIKKFKLNKLPRTEAMDARYSNPDNDSRGPWKSGDFCVGPIRDIQVYPIKTPSGKEYYPTIGRCWRAKESKYKELLADNRIYFGKNQNGKPRIKRFLSEVSKGVVPKTLWLANEVGSTMEAKKEAKSVNSKDIFDTPKPERLLTRIIELSTNANDIVFDPFSGTGTTAVVAAKLGRNSINMEINEQMFTHILPRIINIQNKDLEINLKF